LAPANHWKLGLFVVSAVGLGVLTIVVLGAQSLKKETTSYKTYFDESVQGLEVGSPVKFRGVTLGSVSKIDIAPDHRLVEVTSDLQVKEILRLKLSVGQGKKTRMKVTSDLRIQLDSAGITGVKYLLLDFFSEHDNPPPALPFAAPENYIPSAVSTIKNLQASVVRSLNRLPDVTDAMVHVLGKVDRAVRQIERGDVPEKVVSSIRRVDRVLASAEGLLGSAQRAVRGLQTAELSQQAQQMLAGVSATTRTLNDSARKLDGLIDKLSKLDGVYSGMERATASVVDVARNASGASEELAQTLRAIRQAAGAIQKLADALETDSDMLLKGRTRRTP